LSITIQHTQETLCKAHIHALAAMAGVNLEVGRVYDYGVDGSFKSVIVRGNRRVESGFSVDFQAKSTYAWHIANGNVVYDLEAKNYNDIVSRSAEQTKLILVLLCLPRDQDAWHVASLNNTTLQHCCYWAELRGELTANGSKKRILIPQANILTGDSLKALLAAETAYKRSFFS